jgi:DNA-binding CsgD family transcriptional regulator
MTLTTEEDWSRAVAALDSALSSGEEVDDLAVLGNLGNAALQLGDDHAQQRFYTLALSRARDRGAVTSVVYALQRLCFGHLLAGDLAAVRNNAEEALALGQSIGERAMTAPPLAWLALLAALQDRDDYDSRLRDLDEVVAACPLGILTDPVHDLTRWAKGIRAAGAGDNFGSLHHLGRFRLPVLARMAAVERIDAAVRAGEPDVARRWIDELAGFAEGSGRAWARAAVAYGRAMTTAEADEAEGLFQEALSHHQHSGRRLDEARTHLAYGEWLRRTQRRVDARQHLRHALETFGDEHAETLVRRATQELRASGETARKRDVSTQVQLTPMELKVAQLVASGLSNKDVAAQIWVSPRTVAFHLRNVFAKAGVTSRGELAQLELT